jgi:hypothetical protein
VFPVFAVANLKSGNIFDQAIYTTASGLVTTQAATVPVSLKEKPIANATSDRPERTHYDLEQRYPLRPSK